jgi:hypothetical protein
MRVCEEAGNVIATDQYAGGFKRPYVPLATIFLNITLRPGSLITAVQPFALANARIFFSRAVRAALFTISAGQQG